MSERLYSVEEANALLPTLTESLRRIRDARQVVLAGGKRVRRSARFDGGGTPGKEYWEALASLKREVEDFADRGIVLRDAERGIVDFPARLEDRDAYLCWRLGEERVGHWHGPETGFAGRKPL